MKTLTVEQAYAAMYYFLVDYYERSHSDEIGGLLGSLSLLVDGSPADSAMWADWMRAVEQGIEKGKAGPFILE